MGFCESEREFCKHNDCFGSQMYCTAFEQVGLKNRCKQLIKDHRQKTEKCVQIEN